MGIDIRESKAKDPPQFGGYETLEELRGFVLA